jgi:hypothetical protein
MKGARDSMREPPMDDLETFGKLLDELMADGITLRAFMIQAALELARLHPNHEAWANEFITNLQARVSPNESQSRLVWRLARERIDALGALLRDMLRNPDGPDGLA